MSKRFSTVEPAERPFTVALSHAEVIALVNYHSSTARRIPKALGKASLELRGSTVLWSSREMKRLHDVARVQLEAHVKRAQGLLSIVKS